MSDEFSNKAIAIAKRIVDRKNVAVLGGDFKVAKACSRHYDRLVRALNGGTAFGCRAGPNSVGVRLEAELAAPDGDIPSWGQSGRFFISVNGMASVVEFDGEWSMGGVGHFAFHACQFDRPYISETGYRSDFVHGLPSGLTVRQAAEQRLSYFQREEKARMIESTSYAVSAAEFKDLAFVIAGLRSSAETLPTVGQRVRLGKQIGLVTANVAENAKGKIDVALLTVDRASRHRNAPLSTIQHRQVWPWEVSPMSAAELQESTDPGKHLTIGMITALATLTT